MKRTVSGNLKQPLLISADNFAVKARNNNRSPFGIWLSLAIAGLLLSACGQLGDTVQGNIIEYNGTGLHQSDGRPTLVSGNIQYKNFSGGELKVEARRSVPCQFGRCPVVGEAPVAEKKLDAPGPYTLELPQSAKDLMIIATLQAPGGAVRIAHLWLLSDAEEIDGANLSLDRPYSPLR